MQQSMSVVCPPEYSSASPRGSPESLIPDLTRKSVPNSVLAKLVDYFVDTKWD
jgi:hypothetical protein